MHQGDFGGQLVGVHSWFCHQIGLVQFVLFKKEFTLCARYCTFTVLINKAWSQPVFFSGANFHFISTLKFGKFWKNVFY
jgi:uncharacterized membrane protein